LSPLTHLPKTSILSTMTFDEKLKILRKVWGYVEISQVTVRISGWRVWLVKNYRGKPISEMDGSTLPGNPKATKKIEFSGNSAKAAVDRAYRSTKNKMKVLLFALLSTPELAQYACDTIQIG
jgi:hypothetical protein